MPRRILVVDDEPDIRLLITIALEDGGWDVVDADGGAEALRVLECDSQFEAVLLDANMPGMDGPATSRALRQHPAATTIPVIFLSAAASQMTEALLGELGALAAIAKPFDVDTLAQQIDALLTNRANPVPSTGAAAPRHVQEAWEAVRDGVARDSGKIRDLLRELDTTIGNLRRAAHSLAGKAPMVGLGAVGSAGRELEVQLAGDEFLFRVHAAAAAVVGAIESAPSDPGIAPSVTTGPTQPASSDRRGSLVAIDDDQDLLLLVRGAFEEAGWEVRTASDETALLQLLEMRTPDGIMLDVDMPEVNGFELCARLRQRAEFRDVPVLFLTSRSDPKDVATGLALGSEDYLVKPIALPELVTRVTSRVERSRLLLREAHYDPLTGLMNRRAIEQILAAVSVEARWADKEMAVAVIDLDHFKQVNDRYGHPAGDTVLKSVAERIAVNLRRSDHCGRWGGEEFLLVFPRTDLAMALQVLHRVSDRVRASGIEVAPGESPAVTFSAGVAIGVPSDERGSNLVEAADEACYEAKRRGRNQIVAAPVRR